MFGLIGFLLSTSTLSSLLDYGNLPPRVFFSITISYYPTAAYFSSNSYYSK
jgi:hypothetical protein